MVSQLEEGSILTIRPGRVLEVGITHTEAKVVVLDTDVEGELPGEGRDEEHHHIVSILLVLDDNGLMEYQNRGLSRQMVVIQSCRWHRLDCTVTLYMKLNKLTIWKGPARVVLLQTSSCIWFCIT